MDGGVGRAVEHEPLDLGGEHALAADLGDGTSSRRSPTVSVRTSVDLERPGGPPGAARPTCSACQIASGDARVASRITSAHGEASSSSRSSRSYRSRRASARRSPWGVPAVVLSFTVGSWSTLASSALVRPSTAACWRSSSPDEAAGEAGDLGLAEVLGPGVEGGDQRGGRTGRHLGAVALGLVVDDGVDGGDLPAAALDAGLGEGAQVVDVEQRHARQLADRRVDVAGHGHVDHQERVGVAPLERRSPARRGR